jgi:succinoglycan biosynthesis protein ExoA
MSWEHGPVTDRPSLAVIIPAAHATATLGEAIEAVKSQDYPELETIVVAAHDAPTAELARSLGADVVDNPSGLTPVGLNLALAAIDSEIVARVDAHSIIPPGYLTRAVGTLLRTGAANVGGMQVPFGTSFWERAIAGALSSPLGSGDARYRIGGSEGPAETVYLGVFRHSVLDSLGGFDEEFVRNQDYELNHRIRESGGVVWFDPELRVAYRPRGSLAKLARQYFDYGRAKRLFSRRHPGALRLRQLAPPLLVGSLVVCVIGSLWAPALLIGPAAYAALLVVGALLHFPRIGIAAAGLAPCWAVMHLSWGSGFLIGR